LDPFYRESAAACNYLDSYLRYEGAAANVITGLDHLIGETVRVWANGARHADCVVDEDGEIALNYEVTPVVVGLPYTGRYQSAKLAFPNSGGTALNQLGRPTHIAFLLLDSVKGAIRFGSTFDLMDPLPDRDQDSYYDEAPGLWTGESDTHSFPSGRERDPRLCIEVEAPYPVTIQGIVLHMVRNGKA
jgi:hypothetical protein